MRVFLSFILIPSIWLALHVWVARRQIARGRDYPPAVRRLIWVTALTIFILPMISFIGRRVGLPGTNTHAVQWIGFICMGLSTLLIAFTMAIDTPAAIARASLAIRRWWHQSRSPDNQPPADPDLISPGRRRFFADVANYGIVGGATGLSAAGFVAARRVPRVVETEIPVPGLHPDLDGLRIAQLSDVHVGPTIRGTWLDKVVEVVNGLEPDLVALTGDFIDGFVHEIGWELEGLSRLRSRHGSFFVTGNHEYYWDGPAWCETVAALGPTVLHNEHRVIEHGGARLLVAGVPDIGAVRHERTHISDPAKAKADAPEHDYSLLLAHQPKSIYDASKAGFNLQLSGHTHAGQYFPGSLLIHLAQPYVKGLALHDNTHIYVSAGTGYWGPPNRAGSPSEISLLTLRRA